MNMESRASDHWTDDQLIAHLYGVGPENRHLDLCADCTARLACIYAKLAEPEKWFSAMHWKRWASAGAASVLLGAGVVLYQEHETQQIYDNALSDAQLAQDVSTMAQNTEAQPTAPLQALFEE